MPLVFYDNGTVGVQWPDITAPITTSVTAPVELVHVEFTRNTDGSTKVGWRVEHGVEKTPERRAQLIRLLRDCLREDPGRTHDMLISLRRQYGAEWVDSCLYETTLILEEMDGDDWKDRLTTPEEGLG